MDSLTANSPTQRDYAGLERILDANANRLREGIRVLEDIARYALNSEILATRLKSLRHQVRFHPAIIHSRDAANDVLKHTMPCEMARDSLRDVIVANFKRAQESARVLEEISKIHTFSENIASDKNGDENPTHSEIFKRIRYELYEIEKEFYTIFGA